MIYIPMGYLASDDDEAAARRKRLAEALRNGEAVSITSSGETVTSDNKEVEGLEAITVPEGKLAR